MSVKLPNTSSEDFYPRPPGGGRLRYIGGRLLDKQFLSTPSGWRATENELRAELLDDISIHALRVEGDPVKSFRRSITTFNFYPRPPGGGRPFRPMDMYVDENDFYPRPPGGGRRAEEQERVPKTVISIHALRVEGDPEVGHIVKTIGISIHALRVEGDSKNGQSFHLFLRKREKNLPL